ncbi:MAG: preprotein translocase subunit YajC [Polyangiaceae bacterium]|nr:preprotein translocase subunit YajC [Polyangiaceae bacterium]
MSSAAFAFQQVPPAPGRPEGKPLPKTTEQTPGTAQPQHDNPPPSAPGGGLLTLPLLLLGALLVMMFWSSRSQQKKQQATLAALKRGDRVLTQSGLVGKLVEVGDRYAKVEIAPGVRIDLLKSALVGKDTAETAASVEKKN